MKFQHFGIPASQEKNWAGYVAELGVHFTDPSVDPFQIEWIKFDLDSPTHKAVQTKPHVAFQVDDLDAALVGKKILVSPMSPMPGLRIAFIDHDGAIIELSETR